MDERDNTFKQLDALLKEAGLKVTFSRWCISGLVPDCACWRCLKERGIEATEETNRTAEERSKRETEAFRKRALASFRNL